jgi:2-pyrone-4,6-dicarboxylate lactonase
MGASTSVSSDVDCHFHVIGPHAHFPMHPARSYTPALADVQQWREVLGPLGITHGVVVQPSVYGTDNRAMLVALAEGAGQLAGIAAVDASVTDAELMALASAGVRGVRMAHFEAGDPRAMGGFVSFAAFDALEERLHAHGLHLQLFTDSRLLPGIAERLRRAKVPVVIDHMGRTPASLGLEHSGFAMLRELLADGRVWVKLSGVANISEAEPDYGDARLIHESLIDANVERVVWGSDWPHTRPSGTAPRTADLFRLFLQWTPATADRERILQSNPRRLYGI